MKCRFQCTLEMLRYCCPVEIFFGILCVNLPCPKSKHSKSIKIKKNLKKIKKKLKKLKKNFLKIFIDLKPASILF